MARMTPERLAKLPNTSVRVENGWMMGWTVVRFHQTDIVGFSTVDGQTLVSLKHGGFRTATTKRRMNQVAEAYGLKYRVYQKNSRWYVDVMYDKEKGWNHSFNMDSGLSHTCFWALRD